MKLKHTKRLRPISIHDKGGTSVNCGSKIARQYSRISPNGMKQPISQYGLGNRENQRPRKKASLAIAATTKDSVQGVSVEGIT